jgi:hypothetical protein
MKYLVFLIFLLSDYCIGQGTIIQNQTRIENGKVIQLNITKELDENGDVVKVDSTITESDLTDSPSMEYQFNWSGSNFGSGAFTELDSMINHGFFEGFPFLDSLTMDFGDLPEGFNNLHEQQTNQIELLLKKYREQIENYYRQLDMQPKPENELFIPDNQKTSKI